ncbi:hypothetical protein BN1221_02535 [Brenneria goodwinii]|uniref:Uncharacterized protein n=1 Tax=Brenneria goodwinii TaxID=1109412 RepID=A0A0G4JVX8_9GAMM|nr:hypothetical protein BN1221_02535 [Brenneria goodwinii]
MLFFLRVKMVLHADNKDIFFKIVSNVVIFQGQMMGFKLLVI